MRHVCQGRRLNRDGELVAGRFELYDQIGRGGAGSVWRAYDRKHGEFVAAKLLTHTDAAMVLRFVREQSLRVHHPNVVAPSGWAADDDRVVLRMDLVRGGCVATLMGDHGPLPPEVFDQLGPDPVRLTTTGPRDRGVASESSRRVLRVVAIVCFVGMVALLVAAVVVLVR